MRPADSKITQARCDSSNPSRPRHGKLGKTLNPQSAAKTVRLVYGKENADGHIETAVYGGKDVGVGGERYDVRKEGSRYLVDVPANLAHLLATHGFVPTGAADKQKVEAAAQHALAANKADRKPKARPRPMRERYAALLSFVAFARGEDAELPGIPLRYTRATMLAGGHLVPGLLPPQAREWTSNVLRHVAEAAAKSASSRAPNDLPAAYDIALPALPAPRLRMIGARPVFISAHNALNDLVDSLARTLEQAEDLNRLKICPNCAALFVALNEQSQACSPRCSNTLRQRRFWAAKSEKTKQTLASEYRKNHARNRVQRRKKGQLRALGQATPPRWLVT
jgi:hypothetical protein